MIIEEDWSPAQIAGVLKKEGIHICKQTIYNHVHADTTGKLASHMPHELKYTKRHRALRPTKATNIANRTSIHSRPIEADGKRFGDWEMDTIVDSFGHAIVTLTERSTNFLLMAKLPEGRKALPTAKTVIRLLYPYKKYVKTITTDNGCEFAAHLEITKKLSSKNSDKVIVYFADSYCSWQKGAIENANKLIRKYTPKKANFNNFSDRNEVIIYAVATGLSMIPASLVVVLTITMAAGTKSMVKRNVVVRKLDSLEALGAVTDICSDKTGTLTQGKMVVKKAWLPAMGTYSVGTS